MYILDTGSAEGEDKCADGEDKCVEDENRSINKDKKSVPVQFEGFTNKLEVCTWLVERPNILQLANKMLDAKMSSLDVTSDGFPESHNLIPLGGSAGASTSSLKNFSDGCNSSNVVEEVRIISPYSIILLFVFIII